MTKPIINTKIVDIEDALSDAQCDFVIEQTRPRLTPAHIGLSRNRVHSPARNALNYKYREDNAWTMQLRQRVAELADEPLEYIEPVEVVCYQKGDYYFRHNDGIDRLASVVINLSSEYEGGELFFDKLDKMYVKIPKGHGLYFEVNHMMRHEVRQVVSGEKWTACVWVNRYDEAGRILSGRDPEPFELAHDSPIIIP